MTFEEILEKYPRLTAFGFDHNPRDSGFESARRHLIDRRHEFDTCVDWLRINPIESRGSYGLKHRIEPSSPTGYVSNGSAIAACLSLGVPIKRYDGVNAVFYERRPKRWIPN